MSIILKQGGQVSLLRSGEFNVESEMESLVAHHPDLLQSEADPELRLVARQVSLGEAGLLDVLLVSEDGLPIAVETKLGSNGESRREIVAQAVDYISSMTQFTNDELDRVCGGRLELALRAFDSEGADSTAGSFERRWQALGANLRAGLARLVLVLDQAPASLVRMVRFLAENSQLDVQLVVLERHLTDGNGGHEVVVPRALVSAESLQRRATVQKEPRPKLKEVVDLYNRDAPPELAAVGASSNYRQIRLSEIKPGLRVHYEFYATASEIGAELHLESDAAKPLAAILKPLEGRALANTRVALKWDPTWNTQRGRLQARFPISAPAEHVAAAMRELIQLTREPVARRAATL